MQESIEISKAEKVIKKIMRKGKIPGVCIVIVRKGEEDIITSLGYADVKKKIPVTPDTLFELASSSKGFTGLAILQLEKKKLINLNDPVTKYFPYFYVKYNEEKYDLTIKQLLYHTSGINWQAISLIPAGKSEDSLQKAVRKIVGLELISRPGSRLGYSSVNYDILGAIIEKVTGKTFEDYLYENVFKSLGLNSTTVGIEKDQPLLASGYKAGLFFPGKYDAPVFRGNNPAAYVISNGKDIARWLKIQMGLVKTSMHPLIKKTHKPAANPSYSLWDKYSYGVGAGWVIQKKKGGEVFHTGWNPTFTTYIGFKPKEKIGLAVLANSNSFNTLAIADYVMALISGERGKRIYLVKFSTGKYSPLISFFSGFFLVFAVHSIISVVSGILAGARHYIPLTEEKTVWLILGTCAFITVLFGFFLYPAVNKRTNWRTLFVWSAKSFRTAVKLILLSLNLGFILFLLLLFFP